jgi:probable rRNA maturation factor
VWEGVLALPFVLHTKVIILEQENADIHERALTLFASKAKRELSIRITSSVEIRELNRRFRRKNKPTDVLSFPSDTPRLAGDIAISAEIAAANANELGHSVDTELKILILHGLLHLVGYDHETDDGEMQAKESKLRQQLKLPVGLIERTNGQPSARKRVARPAARKGRRQ